MKLMRQTSKRTATPDETDPFADPDPRYLRQFPGQQDNGVLQEEVVASSSAAAEPPPYRRERPLDDPFRDYPRSNVTRNSLNRAEPADAEAALPTTAMLIEPLPTVPTDTVFDEDLLPPLPYRPPGLSRGLQIPSRVSFITWGFSFPKVLPEQGVTKEQWQLFKHELESFARMTMSQRITVRGTGFLVGHFFGPISGWYMYTVTF